MAEISISVIKRPFQKQESLAPTDWYSTDRELFSFTPRGLGVDIPGGDMLLGMRSNTFIKASTFNLVYNKNNPHLEYRTVSERADFYWFLRSVLRRIGKNYAHIEFFTAAAMVTSTAGIGLFDYGDLLALSRRLPGESSPFIEALTRYGMHFADVMREANASLFRDNIKLAKRIIRIEPKEYALHPLEETAVFRYGHSVTPLQFDILYVHIEQLLLHVYLKSKSLDSMFYFIASALENLPSEASLFSAAADAAGWAKEGLDARDPASKPIYLDFRNYNHRCAIGIAFQFQIREMQKSEYIAYMKTWVPKNMTPEWGLNIVSKHL